MPEIGPFGSEGGAPTHGVPTLSIVLSLRDKSHSPFEAPRRGAASNARRMLAGDYVIFGIGTVNRLP